MYEYRMEDVRIVKSAKELNEIAAEGWKVVAILNHLDGYKYRVLFEREIKD